MLSALFAIIGLAAFEIISSVDNAIINAYTLRTMSQKGRALFWKIVVPVAVFGMRGLLPFGIVYLTKPEETGYILLIGGGMFLALLYLHWLFLEKKDPYFVPDKLVKPHHDVWFFGIAAVLLVAIMCAAIKLPLGMLSAATGSAVFFILYGFRETAARKEHELANAAGKDLARIFFLAILDASFSIDGVLGAFAFTKNVWYIVVGNGIGAIVVAYATLRGIEKVGQYKWLKNGAMTSIGLLGAFMMLEAFGTHIPQWLPAVTTVGLVGMTYYSSHRHLKKPATRS